MEVGIRVVRGPDWIWKNQDGGEGFVGTVVEVGRHGSPTSPDKTVVVQWDSGFKTNYRIGYQGAYDVRIFDTAQIGVRHAGVSCSACSTHSIRGMRWMCSRCQDINLCTPCYMGDQHDINHAFKRIDRPDSPREDLPSRQGEALFEARGIFQGAKVVRGPNWDWVNQDGGEGKVGKVIEIQGWEQESGRSVARVTWTVTGMTNVYRLAHKGKMDLKLAGPGRDSAASGGNYYPDHLPLLGRNSGLATECHFVRGNKVRVDCSLMRLRGLQEGHGGWNDKMAEYIGQEGIVHRITDKGDVRVQFSNCPNRWTFHPSALTLVEGSGSTLFHVGDRVRVLEDSDLLLRLQRGHGDTGDAVLQVAGHVGVVRSIVSEGIVKVAFPDSAAVQADAAGDSASPAASTVLTLNEACCRSLMTEQSGEASTSNAGAGREMAVRPRRQLTANSDSPSSTAESCLDEIFEKLMVLRDTPIGGGPERLVREAAQGRTPQVREILGRYPVQVDTRSSSKTALQVASHEGHLEILNLLIAAKASLDACDDEGDTALHYACFGNQPEVVAILVENGARVDATNKSLCTPLHVSVNKQHLGCVEVLLKYNANINLQDSYGDTPLHDALGKDHAELVKLLIKYPRLDLTARNRRGFNCLHFAALKGRSEALTLMLERRPDLVDSRKEDGFAPLHLAALNGHYEAAQRLLDSGTDVDTRNLRDQIPLHLAVSQGHLSMIELLLEKGSGLNVIDEERNSCLHLAVSPSVQISADPGATDILARLTIELNTLWDRQVARRQSLDKPPYTPQILLAAFLLMKGANLNQWLKCRNRSGKTPQDCLLSLATSSNAVVTAGGTNNSPSTPALSCDAATMACLLLHSWAQQCLRERLPQDAFCEVCSDDLVDVTFEPCRHRVTCSDCCMKMRRCIKCKEQITRKVKDDGSELNTLAGPRLVTDGAPESLAWWGAEEETLRGRLQELEDQMLCNICMDAPRSVAFLCGHQACARCAEPLDTCHMCRKAIQKKINLF